MASELCYYVFLIYPSSFMFLSKSDEYCKKLQGSYFLFKQDFERGTENNFILQLLRQRQQDIYFTRTKLLE